VCVCVCVCVSLREEEWEGSLGEDTDTYTEGERLAIAPRDSLHGTDYNAFTLSCIELHFARMEALS
jgi:hypothetical protein